MEIKFTKATTLKEKPQDESNLGFGRLFSDYMFTMRYDEGQGWHDAEVKPYEYFNISPASTVLHYSQEVFEGLKAYRTQDGSINLFRSMDNFKRMSKSAERLSMPQFDEAFANTALKELLRVDQDWVPRSDGTSLYIRPNYIGVDPFLGVSAASSYLFYIIMGPVGSYYANGLAPIRILVEKEYTRSSRGGMGFAKTGGNYAASLLAGEEAHKKGCDQALWLDSKDRKFVEEVGSMNIMFVIDGTIITPPLDGTILPGITRDSVLQIAHSKNMPVQERHISIDEVIETAQSGAMTEAFGTGTAAVVSPIGEFLYGDQLITVNGKQMGELSKLFYQSLTDIQYSRIPDPFGWVTKVV